MNSSGKTVRLSWRWHGLPKEIDRVGAHISTFKIVLAPPSPFPIVVDETEELPAGLLAEPSKGRLYRLLARRHLVEHQWLAEPRAKLDVQSSSAESLFN